MTKTRYKSLLTDIGGNLNSHPINLDFSVTHFCTINCQKKQGEIYLTNSKKSRKTNFEKQLMRKLDRKVDLNFLDPCFNSHKSSVTMEFYELNFND